MKTRDINSYAALIAGILSVSFAATFIRLADAAPAFIAALRMIIASVLLLPWALSSKDFRREIKELLKRDAVLLGLSGLFLSLHFLLWITSLSHTGVASSVAFVATSPLFVALYSVIVLREGVSKLFWLGLAVSVAGGIILGGVDLLDGSGSWVGDVLAIGGALAGAGYFLVGSRLRKSLSLITYIFPVYSVAGIILGLLALSFGITASGIGRNTYFYCFLLALVCQVGGHSLFNWALKSLKATVVTIATLGEPVGASVIALLVLRESPSVSQVIGGGFILAGIFIVLYFNPLIVDADACAASDG